MTSTMPAPGMTVPSVSNARALLVRAQGVAADAIEAPDSMTPDLFNAGIVNAVEASEMLLKAEPRSKFQDLKQASQHAIDGAHALGEALTAYAEEIPADLAFANVKEHAWTAFNAFESAFEIIDND
jgi:hypothetical protein